MTPEEEQEQRVKITGWVEEGRKAGRERKERNHALIQLGLASLAMIRAGQLDAERVLEHVIISKKPVVKKWVANETGR